MRHRWALHQRECQVETPAGGHNAGYRRPKEVVGRIDNAKRAPRGKLSRINAARLGIGRPVDWCDAGMQRHADESQDAVSALY